MEINKTNELLDKEIEILNRNKNGTLTLKHLDLEIFLGELFLKCRSEKEIDWLQKQINETVDVIADEARKGEL